MTKFKMIYGPMMTFAPDGGSGDGGAAGAAGAAGAGAAGAGAGGAGAAGAGAGAGAAGAGDAGAGAAGAAWYAGVKSEELRGLAQLKGWQSVDDALTSYVEIEKLKGRDKLVAPKDENDTAAYDAIYEKLGRPKTHVDYKLDVPEGGNAAYVEHMAKAFHAAGMTTKQAKAAAEANNAFVTEHLATMDAKFATTAASEMNNLRQTLGKDYDRYAAAGQSAAHQLGVDKPTLQKIERAMGTKAMFEFFANVGVAMGEDTFEEGSDGANAFRSIEAAKARKQQLKNDPAWAERFRNNDVAALAEMEKLNAFIAESMDTPRGQAPNVRRRAG